MFQGSQLVQGFSQASIVSKVSVCSGVSVVLNGSRGSGEPDGLGLLGTVC